MGKQKSEKENKECVVAFRATKAQNAQFIEAIKKSGVSRSEFFLRSVINAKPVFEAPAKDWGRLLFLYNKSSNNLNQLALKVNHAYRRSGVISESLYIKVNNELVLIRELLMAGMNNDH